MLKEGLWELKQRSTEVPKRYLDNAKNHLRMPTVEKIPLITDMVGLTIGIYAILKDIQDLPTGQSTDRVLRDGAITILFARNVITDVYNRELSKVIYKNKITPRK